MIATDDAKAAELAAYLKAALGDLSERITTNINPRARRISLRLDPTRGQVVLVRPRGVSARAATRFAVEMRPWIEARLESLPPRLVFQDGVVIPYLGTDHVIRHAPDARRGVWREDGVIYVSGRKEHVARRVTDWLKAEAKNLLSPMARGMAESLGCKIARISVRDTRSRWGSCSADGKLSFSWRLILAPENILTYVAAHEVAHLRHLDHSRAFWRTVSEALTAYVQKNETKEILTSGSAREWLRRSGTALHAYG
jgi:predicted metal-dependent hydrolase